MCSNHMKYPKIRFTFIKDATLPRFFCKSWIRVHWYCFVLFDSLTFSIVNWMYLELYVYQKQKEFKVYVLIIYLVMHSLELISLLFSIWQYLRQCDSFVIKKIKLFFVLLLLNFVTIFNYDNKTEFTWP